MRKLLTTLFLTILTAATPAYALAATLSLSPSTGTFNKGCAFTLDVDLDTQGIDTDGTDAIILYDNSKLTTNSSAINTELTPKIYSDFPGNSVDDATGKITVSGLASVSTVFNGKGTLTKITFTVKEGAATGATIVRFDFDPADKTKTTDSNVVQRGTVADVLSSVTNGNYVIGTGSCAQPTPSPVPGGEGSKGGGGVIVVPPPSAQIPVKELPPSAKELPPAGSEQFTFMLAILGTSLTVLGILGLILL